MISRFRNFFIEGGNVKVGEQQAQQIDLSKVERKVLVKDLIASLVALNRKFAKINGLPLWSDEKFLTSGKVFSGSSEHFVNLEISDEEFAKSKPLVGDIDVQVDKTLEPYLSQLLSGKEKFGNMTYVGRSETSIGQISGLFKFEHKKMSMFVQVDFEFVDVDSMGLPTPWEKFAHSSDWKDIQAGIKGVFHKFLFGSIDFASQKDIIVLKGKKKTPKKMRVHDLAFSVGKGMRSKYAREVVNGKAVVMNGLPVFVETDSKTASYTKDLEIMFQMLFGYSPSKGDLASINSFVGLVDLVSKNFKGAEKTRIFDEFVERTWGNGGQKLYRGNHKMDLEQKAAAINYMMKKLGLSGRQKDVDLKMKEYYSKY